jgi:hypothetical protein
LSCGEDGAEDRSKEENESSEEGVGETPNCCASAFTRALSGEVRTSLGDGDGDGEEAGEMEALGFGEREETGRGEGD